MKRFVLPVLAACVLAAACGGSPRPDAQTIVVAIEQEPTTLDPRLAADAYSSRVSSLIFAGLLRTNRDGRLVPDLADRYELPDARTFVFHLREGLRFHDGRPLTSADVAFTVNSILDPATQSPRQGAFKEVNRIETPDPLTVIFRLKKPFAPFLTGATQGIVPANLGGKSADAFGRAPVGCGPWRFRTWETNSRILLDAWPEYPGGAPKIPHAIFKILPNETIRMLELRKGSVDLLQNNVPPYAVKFLRKDPQIRVMTRPGINFSYLGFNLEDPLLGRREVREAIAHAIDREGIIRHIREGLAVPATGILAPTNWAYEGNVETYAYDPARSRALLRAAGFPDPAKPGAFRFPLVYKTSTVKERIAIGEAIVQSLRELGIDARLRSIEFGTFFSDVRRGNFQIYSLTWTGVTDPDILYTAFHSASVPPGGANRGRYRNPRLDALVERARAITDEAERKTLYAEAQRIVAHDLPYVPLWYETDVAAMRRRIEHYEPWPSGDFGGLAQATIRGGDGAP